MRCPSCGGENRPDAAYCTLCGGELTGGGLDARGRLLFFSTPFVFLLAGIAFALDLGLPDPVNTGVGIGVSILGLSYLVVGGGAWIVCRSFGLPFGPTMPWRAGVFGTFQLIAAALLAQPVQELLMPEGFPRLTFADQDRLRLGLVFALFLPLLGLGLSLLILRDQPAGNGSEGSWWRRLSRFGAAPVFLGTVVAGFLLVQALPEHRREYLLARLGAEFSQIPPALENLERSLAAQPDFPPALHLRGLLLVAGADRERAAAGLQDLERAARLASGDARLRLDLALALHQFGRLDEAEAAASAAAGLKPFDPAPWTTLADIRLRLGDGDGAVQAYREALKLDPEDPRTLNNLGYTLLELDRDLGTALELARASVRRQPDHFYNLDTLAWALYKNGQTGEAYQTMLQIKEAVGSVSAEIDFHMAVISHGMGLLAEPRRTLEELWQRPEVQSDPMLRRSVTAAIASLGVSIRSEEGGTASSGATLPGAGWASGTGDTLFRPAPPPPAPPGSAAAGAAPAEAVPTGSSPAGSPDPGGGSTTPPPSDASPTFNIPEEKNP
ncbi:MAG: tetratricopeptide repeat protein [Candidatus Riflebacteria bacterium]|nr:tetratricopeptide repeat protein [Candidatus Riflebacteria bacterium]